MVDVYLLETLMREKQADVQRRAALGAALGELNSSRGRHGETPVSRLRRAFTALVPVCRAKRTALRPGGLTSVKSR